MDQEMAATIVERYNAVLAETSNMISGIPESRLPCDQSLIKEAIKQVLKGTSKDSETYMDLQTAFSKLGMFLPEREAEMVAKAEAAMMTMDPAEEGFKYLGQHAEIQKRIQNDMYALTMELNDFITGQEDA